MSSLKKFGILLLTIFIAVSSAFGAEKSEKDFDAGQFIFGHIRNSYGWHITAIGEKEVTIPLPVIVKSQTRGWMVFSSSKLM